MKLPVAGFSFKVFIAAAVSLWLIATLAGQLASLPLENPWPLALHLIARLASIALIGLILWAAWSLIARIAAGLLPALLTTDTVDLATSPPAEETPEIRNSLDGLAKTLAAIEQDRDHAAMKLLDAHQYTTNLASLIKAIAYKAETMRADAASLDAAQSAITGREPDQIAHAAGAVRDSHIQTLMTSDLPLTAAYWSGVSRTIMIQRGTLDQWSSRYDQFSSQLLIEIANHKAHLTNLVARLELSGAARPLIQIQANLDEAQAYLVKPRPRSLETLPVSHVAGLLQ